MRHAPTPLILKQALLASLCVPLAAGALQASGRSAQLTLGTVLSIPLKLVLAWEITAHPASPATGAAQPADGHVAADGGVEAVILQMTQALPQSTATAPLAGTLTAPLTVMVSPKCSRRRRRPKA